MKGTILINYNENTRQVEEEEKSKFFINLLEQMGISTDGLLPKDDYTSVDYRLKLRSLLHSLFMTHQIQVIDDWDGNMDVYVEQDKVASWSKPTYKLKRDLSQLNPRQQFYLEMELNFWSIFEEEPES